MPNSIQVIRTEESLTVSTNYKGCCNDLSRHEMNILVGKLLVKLGEELPSQADYEYDGVAEAEFDDDTKTISISARLFIP